MRYVITVPTPKGQDSHMARQLLNAVHSTFGEGMLQEKPFNVDWGGLHLDHRDRERDIWTAYTEDKILWLQMNTPAEATILENTP